MLNVVMLNVVAPIKTVKEKMKLGGGVEGTFH